MPKYYPINEEAAKRAKDMNSFSDYQPGSATAGYRAMVDEAYAAAERQKARVDPLYHDKIDALVDRYARKLAENLNERNVIDARVPSILISGEPGQYSRLPRTCPCPACCPVISEARDGALTGLPA